jgi:hypothetical protein
MIGEWSDSVRKSRNRFFSRERIKGIAQGVITIIVLLAALVAILEYLGVQISGPNPQIPARKPFISYFNAQLDSHWVTTGSVTEGYVSEGHVGYLFINPGPDLIAFYGCQNGIVHFISIGSNCGQSGPQAVTLGLEGYVYSPISLPPKGVQATAIYFCRQTHPEDDWMRLADAHGLSGCPTSQYNTSALSGYVLTS